MDQKLPVISDTLKHTRDLTERKERKYSLPFWRSQIHIPAILKHLHSLLKLDHTEAGLGEEKHTGQLLSGYKVATQHTKGHRCELRYNCILHSLSQMDWLGNGSITETASELHSQNKGTTEGKKLIQWHYPKAYAPCNPGSFGDSLPMPVACELYSDCQYSSIRCSVSDISQRHSIS